MASKQSTVEFISDQLQELGNIRFRKMFGEYALYCNDKVVALICDDQLFLKPTEGGKSVISNLELAPPYPGAKDYYLITEDYWDDRDYLVELIRVTADTLPVPKPKLKKSIP